MYPKIVQKQGFGIDNLMVLGPQSLYIAERRYYSEV